LWACGEIGPGVVAEHTLCCHSEAEPKNLFFAAGQILRPGVPGLRMTAAVLAAGPGAPILSQGLKTLSLFHWHYLLCSIKSNCILEPIMPTPSQGGSFLNVLI
jgi:hypothetical protein